MPKHVVLLEDDPDLAQLVEELLLDVGYACSHVTTVEDLFRESASRAPCVALVDSTDPKEFDLWHVGTRLGQLGVPAVAFTAHASAQNQFAAGAPGFVGVVTKPFDADEFIGIVEAICWDDSQAAVS